MTGRGISGGERLVRYLPARVLTCAALIALVVLPTACSGLNRNLGGDPCLLQQYQGHSGNILSRVQGALSTLQSNADALSRSQGTINASQDISETLTAIAEFQLNLSAQWAQVQTGAMPSEGAAFRSTLKAAIDVMDSGAQLLTQAYVDTANGDTRAAALIVTAARTDFQEGRRLLGQANVQISSLTTYNPNC
jgi:hypothetical protein